ncbi:MAG: hypothetical protein M0D55_08785 [Elusimicrobiota bacterium]|nr:MAG: hypothetical protein M0D55_08785 [Elusimicrobiota bacterium]
METTDDALAQPQDLAIDLHEMKASQRAKSPSCARCSLNAKCLGYEPEYARLYGAEDFAPC